MSNRTDTPIVLGASECLASTGRLTTEGHGAYLLLLLDAARYGPPPDNDEILAAIARLPPRRWAKLRPALLGLFVICDGRWHRRAGTALPSPSPPQSVPAATARAARADGAVGEEARDLPADAPAPADAAASTPGEPSPRDAPVYEEAREVRPHESARPHVWSQPAELTERAGRNPSHLPAENESASGAVEAAAGAPAAREAPGDSGSGAPTAPDRVDAAPGGDTHSDGLMPLDALLATMRWAHRRAESAPSSTIATLRKLAIDAAKAAAPYFHARKRPASEAERGAEPKEFTHEEWVRRMDIELGPVGGAKARAALAAFDAAAAERDAGAAAPSAAPAPEQAAAA